MNSKIAFRIQKYNKKKRIKINWKWFYLVGKRLNNCHHQFFPSCFAWMIITQLSTLSGSTENMISIFFLITSLMKRMVIFYWIIKVSGIQKNENLINYLSFSFSLHPWKRLQNSITHNTLPNFYFIKNITVFMNEGTKLSIIPQIFLFFILYLMKTC